MITDKELELVRWCLARICEKGADWARIAYSKAESRNVDMLNGEVDKIQSTLDAGLGLTVVADGRYGTFSTNTIEKKSLEVFIDKSLDVTLAMEKDEFRKLPARERICRDAVSGYEMESYDAEGMQMEDSELIRRASEACIWGKGLEGQNYKIVSEEGGISISEESRLLMDSEGMECRRNETGFSYGVEMTIEDAKGDLYSGYSWRASAFLDKLDTAVCGKEAIDRAAAQIGSQPCEGGKCNMVLDTMVAGRMVSPLMSSLDGYRIQQKDSFLTQSLGKKLFSEGLTILDLPQLKGLCGSTGFDAEGVATSDGTIIDKGTVRSYFLNTYISGKLGMEPTRDRYTHLKLEAWPEAGLDRDAILRKVGDGIYVTGFNGGNYNSATGDFSYGIEGQVIRNGKLAEPISEMLITGNFLELWNNLIAVGDDAPDYMSNLIPTLAFANVDFNG